MNSESHLKPPNEVAGAEHARHAALRVPRRMAGHFLADEKPSRWDRLTRVFPGVAKTHQWAGGRRTPPVGQRIRRLLTGSLTSHPHFTMKALL